MVKKAKTDAADFLKNLVPAGGYLKAAINEGIVALRSCVKDLSAVHIRIAYPVLSTWRKKKYYHITKQEICSRLDEWIFEHLVKQDEYAAYLDRYRPMIQDRKIKKDIDEYIMDRHYRPKAIKILRCRKHFDLALWMKKRICLEYRRRSNLYWKSGEEFRFDYRNSVESLLSTRTMAIEK